MSSPNDMKTIRVLLHKFQVYEMKRATELQEARTNRTKDAASLDPKNKFWFRLSSIIGDIIPCQDMVGMICQYVAAGRTRVFFCY